MRKLFMAVAILGISATVSFAKAQCVNENGNKEPFAVEFGKLSSKIINGRNRWRIYVRKCNFCKSLILMTFS